jgi:3-hydroxyacyl-CoA dehydrogenase/enoyl-CoA hydratase/3-hydroxybutyryl-CoA epimerase
LNPPIRTELDADGVLLATIDMPGRSMNVFSVELMDALDQLMDRVDSDDAVRSCVITSAKPTFLAGADLVMVRGYTDAAKTSTHDQMMATCGRLGRQFVRLEASAKPFVAAVNGLALGGGLELALACRARVVADDPKVQLGLPEVRWGLLPGAGGTQRLPRLAGFEAGMDMLLTGRSVDPATALRLSIATAVAPASTLVDQAKTLARGMHHTPLDTGAKFANLAMADVPLTGTGVAEGVATRFGVSTNDFRDYPAYSAIIDAVLEGARLPLAQATTVEMEKFMRLMFSPVAGHMVRTLFLERLRADRELAAPSDAGIAQLRVGPDAPADWAKALAKLKLPQQADAALPAGTLEATDTAGRSHRATLRVLAAAAADAAGTQLVLAPAGPYGRVLEIATADDAAAATFSVLAAKLWSLPWRSPGPGSRLQALRGLPLAEQARIAGAWTDMEPAFTDVAACLAGVTPAWSGGPLIWLADRPAGQ